MLGQYYNVTWGTDPEAFFKKDGQIIGSERIIPENGVNMRLNGKIVRDGVQFELNPSASQSIQALGTNISILLQEANRLAKKNGAELCFDGLVEVSRKELDGLAPRSRILGCQPSQNVYGASPINVDPVEYRKRSSGGHIHAGIFDDAVRNNRITGVPLFDLFVGNTGVLLDRDPGAAERRQNYGRAGECRLQDHGLEYRTPSNFWIRDYSLMSLVYGMSALAISILYQKAYNQNKEWDALVAAINIEDVITAINTNNFDLALANFEKLIPFLEKNLPPTPVPFQLTPGNLRKFVTFAQDVNANGIEKYFPTEGIVERWVPAKFREFNLFLQQV